MCGKVLSSPAGGDELGDTLEISHIHVFQLFKHFLHEWVCVQG